MVVGVLVELSNKNIDKVFDYNVPEELTDSIKIGVRVEVPFGRQILDGFVLEVKNESSMELKDIISVKDVDIVLNDELLALGKSMSNEYLATLISCYQVMLPKALKAKINGKNYLKLDTFYKLNDMDINSIKLTDKQRSIVDLCLEKGLITKEDASPSIIKTLVTKDILVEVKKEHYRLSYSNKITTKNKLTDKQQSIVDEVNNSNDSVYLLYGVTGSGKTEVYMELIEEQLKLGKTSIVLVS